MEQRLLRMARSWIDCGNGTRKQLKRHLEKFQSLQAGIQSISEAATELASEFLPYGCKGRQSERSAIEAIDSEGSDAFTSHKLPMTTAKRVDPSKLRCALNAGASIRQSTTYFGIT